VAIFMAAVQCAARAAGSHGSTRGRLQASDELTGVNGLKPDLLKRKPERVP
jgi:hypothetical protein